eukprot:GILJ01005024.1.p1 GENE.GILJ01005024.1~~GILJ01005024.1.p1  ORF type:complete len:501 (+),score=36.33 GILJ01005024.1:300-1802(+)
MNKGQNSSRRVKPSNKASDPPVKFGDAERAAQHIKAWKADLVNDSQMQAVFMKFWHLMHKEFVLRGQAAMHRTVTVTELPKGIIEQMLQVLREVIGNTVSTSAALRGLSKVSNISSPWASDEVSFRSFCFQVLDLFGSNLLDLDANGMHDVCCEVLRRISQFNDDGRLTLKSKEARRQWMHSNISDFSQRRKKGSGSDAGWSIQVRKHSISSWSESPSFPLLQQPSLPISIPISVPISTPVAIPVSIPKSEEVKKPAVPKITIIKDDGSIAVLPKVETSPTPQLLSRQDLTTKSPLSINHELPPSWLAGQSKKALSPKGQLTQGASRAPAIPATEMHHTLGRSAQRSSQRPHTTACTARQEIRLNPRKHSFVDVHDRKMKTMLHIIDFGKCTDAHEAELQYKEPSSGDTRAQSTTQQGIRLPSSCFLPAASRSILAHRHGGSLTSRVQEGSGQEGPRQYRPFVLPAYLNRLEYLRPNHSSASPRNRVAWTSDRDRPLTCR